MKRFKAFLTLVFGVLTYIALSVGIASAGAYCMLYFHQPKVPESMSKFRRQE
ncbi:MAG: cyclic lactone autoinducer peptide [Oscillospiraceae bacterium]|jgi:cyclic lactone autoinducer peptide|nr:cyclic lactone autoinducer peptide [Oscillospiraceae bacterium]